jgi:NTE family protein
MTPKTALVLLGGGARGAYQVGVLKALREILNSNECPFQIISGFSAGAINGAWLASGIENWSQSVESLTEVWTNIQLSQVFDTHATSLLQLGSRWLLDISLGNWFNRDKINYLLSTGPLAEMVKSNIDFEKIQRNIENKKLHAIGVSSTNYKSGISTTFFDGDPQISQWIKGARKGQRQTLSPKHVLASASIPIIFHPVSLQDSFYGDGMIRMRAPLSPAIHLGADKIFAISIKHRMADTESCESQYRDLPLGEIIGTLLNVMFYSALDEDIERLERINRTLNQFTPEQAEQNVDRLRIIQPYVIKPSLDLGSLASNEFERFPGTLRHFLNGIGVSAQTGWNILSYLAFNKNYTSRLIELGYQDVFEEKNKILEFFATN